MLTISQISAVLSLLLAFGVSPATVSQVSVILNAPVQATTTTVASAPAPSASTPVATSPVTQSVAATSPDCTPSLKLATTPWTGVGIPIVPNLDVVYEENGCPFSFDLPVSVTITATDTSPYLPIHSTYTGTIGSFGGYKKGFIGTSGAFWPQLTQTLPATSTPVTFTVTVGSTTQSVQVQ